MILPQLSPFQMSLSSPKSIINPYLPRVCFTNKYNHTWNLVWCRCCWKKHPLNNHHINTLIRFFSPDWQVLAVKKEGEENRGRGKRMNKVRDDSIRDRHTERQTGEWMCRKKEMILSKWCFISVINPASQEDEEGLSLSPVTMVRNKGTLMGPIRAKYQISSQNDPAQ